MCEIHSESTTSSTIQAANGQSNISQLLLLQVNLRYVSCAVINSACWLQDPLKECRGFASRGGKNIERHKEKKKKRKERKKERDKD